MAHLIDKIMDEFAHDFVRLSRVLEKRPFALSRAV